MTKSRNLTNPRDRVRYFYILKGDGKRGKDDFWRFDGNKLKNWISTLKFCNSFTKGGGEQFLKEGGIYLSRKYLSVERNVLHTLGISKFIPFDTFYQMRLLFYPQHLTAQNSAVKNNTVRGGRGGFSRKNLRIFGYLDYWLVSSYIHLEEGVYLCIHHLVVGGEGGGGGGENLVIRDFQNLTRQHLVHSLKQTIFNIYYRKYFLGHSKTIFFYISDSAELYSQLNVWKKKTYFIFNEICFFEILSCA